MYMVVSYIHVFVHISCVLVVLADDINCFGTGECFALAFGVPAVLMILSLGKLRILLQYLE